MDISSDILRELAEPGAFYDTFLRYTDELFGGSGLEPKISRVRLYDAHYAWRDDLSRVEGHEKNLVDGLDHFKQCGHLAYWLRRMSPIVEYRDLLEIYEEGEDMYEDERKLRDLVSRYGAEYVAFDFAAQICMAYEKEREDRASSFVPPAINDAYIIDVCHMLKFKHVSPHSLYLIYKSLLLS